MSAISLPRVPEGLRDLMKAYTKEVLREKPINLLEFSSSYFENVAALRTRHNTVQYESLQSYETIVNNRIRQLVPMSLVYQIIPENLTAIVKNFIKAVLKENPDNLLVFAKEYFKNLRIDSTRIDYTKYKAYEKYTEINGKQSFEPKVTCACGRTQVMQAPFKVGQPDSTSEALEKPNYFKAAYIIQKHYRNYLKRKAKKSTNVKFLPKDIYNGQDYLNAIFLIQRQVRRYLSKKRVKNTTKLTNKTPERYDSIKFIQAIYVIQRQCRQYLSRKRLKRSLNEASTLPSDSNVSLVTAALIIQRAFRRMVKTEKYKTHKNAELDQSDEINDNASEAASYTSASTALLSTESTCEHTELGSTNYEEGVHQQTIKEDEEFENENKNRRKENEPKDFEPSEKSILSNGNAAQETLSKDVSPISLHDKMSEIHSIEIHSLQAILKSVNNQTKLSHNEDVSYDNSQLQDEQGNGIGKSIKIQSVLPTEDDYVINIMDAHDIEIANINKNELNALENAGKIINEFENKPQNISLSEAKNALKDNSLDMPEKETLTNEQDIIGLEIHKNEDSIENADDKLETDEAKLKAPILNPSEIICTVAQDTPQVSQNNASKDGQNIGDLSLSDVNASKVDSLSKIVHDTSMNFEDSFKEDNNQDIPQLDFEKSSIPEDNKDALLQDSLKMTGKHRTPEIIIANENERDPGYKLENELQKITSPTIDSNEKISNLTEDGQSDLDILNTSPQLQSDDSSVSNNNVGNVNVHTEPENEIETLKDLKRNDDQVQVEKQTLIDEQHLTNIVHHQKLECGDNIAVSNRKDKIDEKEHIAESTIKTSQIIPEDTPQDMSISSQSDIDSVITNNPKKPLNDLASDAEEILYNKEKIINKIEVENDLTEIDKTPELDSNTASILLDSEEKQSLTNPQDLIAPAPQNFLESDDDPSNLDNPKEVEEGDLKISVASKNALEAIPTKPQKSLQDKQDNDTSVIEEYQDSISATEAEDIFPSQSHIDSRLTNNLKKTVNDLASDAEEILNNKEHIITPQKQQHTDADEDLDMSISSQSDIDSVITNNSRKPLNDLASDAEEILNNKENIINKIEVENDLTEIDKNPKQDSNTASFLLDSEEKQSLTNPEDLIAPAPQSFLESDDDQSNLDNLKGKEAGDLNITVSSINASEVIPTKLQGKQDNDTSVKEEYQDSIPATEPEVSFPLQSDFDSLNNQNAKKNEFTKSTNEDDINYESDFIENNISSSSQSQNLLTTDEDTVTFNISDNKIFTNQKDLIEKGISDFEDKLGEENKHITAIISNQSNSLNDANATKSTEKDLHRSNAIENNSSTTPVREKRNTGANSENTMEPNEIASTVAEIVTLPSTDSSDNLDTIAKNEQKDDHTLSEQTSGGTEKNIQHGICEPSNDENKINEFGDIKGDLLKIETNEVQTEETLTKYSSIQEDVEQDPPIIENRTSSILSNPLIGEQIITNSTNKTKKLHVAKDKHTTSIAKDKHTTSTTSGRLINAPIAELQLKSFSSPSDTGLWYEVHDESQKNNEDTQANVRALKDNIVCKESIKSHESAASSQEVESNNAQKLKPSISFFISFDDGDGKTCFQPPTKFSKNQRKHFIKNISKPNIEKYQKQDLSLKSPIEESNKLQEQAADQSYQEFGTQKLQTIHELNENETGIEPRPKISEYVHNVPIVKTEEVYFGTESSVQDLSQSKEPISDSTKLDSLTESGHKTIANSYSIVNDHDNMSTKSARIIQRAFKNYKARQKYKEKIAVTGPEDIKNISNLAAIKIQKAVRQFLLKNTHNASTWFVGTQPIELLPNSSKAVEESFIINKGTIESQSEQPRTANGGSKVLVETNVETNIGNFVNDMTQNTQIFDKDDETSNNLAGSTKDAEIDYDKGLRAMSDSEMEIFLKEGASTRQQTLDFLIKETEFAAAQEAPCVRKIISLNALYQENNENDNSEAKNREQLQNNNEVLIIQPDRRSAGNRKEPDVEDPTGTMVNDDLVVRPISSLHEQNSFDTLDGDVIVYNRLQREETRESSAQSESVIFGNCDVSSKAEISRTQLSRHYTIAGDDPQSIFKSVKEDETVKYNDNEIMNSSNQINDGNSFFLDDETSENIRKKIMAYSLSETDSDYCDPNKVVTYDCHVDTAMTDAMDTSTETESTIVSAAAKIQAGARGFLTRRRLRRASAGTKSSTLDTKASFGNDAISESLERFIEEEAAKKIQSAYRLHNKKHKKQNNVPKTGSLESSLAAKRQTLQRGDALQKYSNSTPENETTECKPVKTISEKENGKRLYEKPSIHLKWPARRQNSMPVQIDCEVLRVLPKHIRRRIKSAELEKQKNRF